MTINVARSIKYPIGYIIHFYIKTSTHIFLSFWRSDHYRLKRGMREWSSPYYSQNFVSFFLIDGLQKISSLRITLLLFISRDNMQNTFDDKISKNLMTIVRMAFFFYIYIRVCMTDACHRNKTKTYSFILRLQKIN